MERKINPLPQIVEENPEVHHGDFLDGLVFDIHASNSKDNALEEIGADNFRSRPDTNYARQTTPKAENK